MDKDKDDLERKRIIQKNIREILLEKLQNADSDDECNNIKMILKRL